MEENSNNPLGFKNIFNTAFKIFSQILLPSSLGFLIFMILISTLMWFFFPLIFKMSINDFSNTMMQNPNELQEILNSRGFAVNNFLISTLVSCILAPMSAGILQSCKLAFEKNSVPVKTIFSFYNSVYTKRIIVFTIAFKSIIELLTSLLIYLGLPSLSMSILLLLTVLTIFCIPMIIFENLSVKKAFQTSFRTIVPYMITIFLFLFLGGLIAISGALFFGIGILFTLPFWYAMVFTLYFALRGVRGNLVY